MALRDAMCNDDTNKQILHHGSPHWCRDFLRRLKHRVETPPPRRATASRKALESYLNQPSNASLRQQVLRNVNRVLAVMDDQVMKDWMLKLTPNDDGSIDAVWDDAEDLE